MANNKVIYGDQTIMDITDTTAEASDVAAGEVFYDRGGVRTVGTGNYMDKVSNPTADNILITDANGQAVDSGVAITDKADASDLPGAATDSVYGLVKLNPSESVDVNASGQLTVGGRLGQYPNGGGLYYPTTLQPENVAKNSLLLTEATGLDVNKQRTIALFAGANVTLKKTAAAGATTFEVSNTFANRFTCACARSGYATIEEATAGDIIVKVTSVHTANDTSTQLVPYSGATESGNNIIITTDAPLSETDSITKLRLYGSMTFDSSFHCGQGVGTGGVTGQGKLLELGQGQLSLQGNSILVGNGMFNKLNRSALFGASHINHVQGALMSGEGHDSVNGTFVGVAAHGKFSVISADTAFAIGNGTSNTARSNLFEVKSDGRVKATGTPTDNDDLATKGYVDSAIGGGGLTFQTFGNADFTYKQVIDSETSEVINECVAYSTTTGNIHEPKAVKYGRVVNLCGAFKNINVRPDNSAFEMGSVPVGCEPLYTQSILVQGTSQYKFLLQIATDGKLTCSRYSAGTSAIAVPNNAWLNINATYISAT